MCPPKQPRTDQTRTPGGARNLTEVCAQPQVACPIKLAGETLPTLHAPPRLGAHTEEVLRDLLGYDDARVDALRASKAVK